MALAKNSYLCEVLLRVKHVWNPIRTSDIYAMATAVANPLQQLARHSSTVPRVCLRHAGCHRIIAAGSSPHIKEGVFGIVPTKSLTVNTNSAMAVGVKAPDISKTGSAEVAAAVAVATPHF